MCTAQNTNMEAFVHGSFFTRFMIILCRRRWIAKFGAGGPAWDKGCDPALPQREHNRDALFNVYEVKRNYEMNVVIASALCVE